MEFDYTVTTTKNFDEAINATQEEIAKAGIGICTPHIGASTIEAQGKIAIEVAKKVIEYKKKLCD